MLYILDSNVLIDANRDYYPYDRVPEFWNWLLHHCRRGHVKIPVEIFNEVVPVGSRRKDRLTKWMKDNRSDVILDEIARRTLIDRIIRSEYTSDPTATEVEKMGQDPCLLSYAYRYSDERTVVTTERPRPSAHGANRKIPDVCKRLNLKCIHTYEFIRELNFRTDWNR